MRTARRPRLHLAASAAFAALIGGAPRAHAEELEDANAHVELTTAFVTMTEFPLDAAQTPLDRTTFLEARLRIGAEYSRGDLQFVGEIDVVDGQVAGDLTDVGTSRGTDTFARRRDRLDGYYGFTPRALYLRMNTRYGVWSLGQQTPDWGLGLVANAGRDGEGFGLARGSGHVTRAGFGTRPLSSVSDLPPLLRNAIVAASIDLVYRDDVASLWDGDLAGGAGLAVRLEDEAWSMGVLASGRLQLDRSDISDPGGERRGVQAVVVDAYARGLVLGDRQGWFLSVGGEFALTRGHTDRSVLEATREQGAAIAGAGALARVEVGEGSSVLARLEAGWASGDDDPYDDVSRNFGFSTSNRVGLLLFPQVLPMATARSVDRAANPALVQRPAPGLRSLVNQGTVSNALYIYPTVRVRVIEPLELRAGYLLAATSGEWIDPFLTARAGGYALGPAGQRTGSTLLGQELLAAARSRWPVLGGEVEAVVEGALLFPGPTLTALGMTESWLLRAGLTLRR